MKDVHFNAGVTGADSQICSRLVQADGAVARETMGTSRGTAPSTPTGMASGSRAVLVWMQRPESIDLIITPKLHFNIGSESVACYGRAVTPAPGSPTCTAS